VTSEAILVVTGRAILALSPDTGDVLWSWERSPGPAGTPAVGEDLLYHASGRGPAAALVARRIDDGREVWRAPIGSPLPDGPTVDAQTIYVGTEDGLLIALDARAGEERWRFEAAAPIEGPPTVADGLVLFSTQNGRTGDVTVHAVGAEDGEEGWRFAAPRAAPATAVAAGAEAAFVGLSDGRIVALDLQDGNLRWEATSLDAFPPGGVPVAGPGLLIADRLHAYLLDPISGDQRWVFRLADLRLLDDGRANTLTSSPVAAGRAALIADAAGVTSAVDLRSGLRIWSSDVGKGPVSAVVPGPDAVYVASTGPDGSVVALEHDPSGALVSEVSPTVLFPTRALLAYVAAVFLVGGAVLGLFRVLKPVLPSPPAGEDQ
jgi:outer membrane protein assembly factor BamB